MPSNSELRQQITATIIDAIEKNKLLPWRRPWASGKASGRHRNVQGRAYSGINPLLLEIHAEKHGLTSRTWGTYNQWASLGLQVKQRPGHVKPGQWGCTVVLYRPVKKTKIDKDTGKETDDRFLVARQFSVFNAGQVFGPNVEKFQHRQMTPTTGFDADFGPAEELLKATKAVVIHTGDKAFYRRPTPEGSWPNHTEGDWIILPPKEKFVSAGAYYETAFHELAHHSEVRLGWDHRKHGYDYGELVAEMSASYLSAELGVPLGEPLENHAAYLKHWLSGMKTDPSFLIHASSQASKVTDYLLSFVSAGEEATEDEQVGELVGAA
jgi:antirestriction protein ArdC